MYESWYPGWVLEGREVSCEDVSMRACACVASGDAAD
jgi:hypothetical protein